MKYKGSAPLSKFDYASTLVVALSMLLTRQQDPVGLVLFDEAATTVLPPLATQSQVAVIAGLLERCTPGAKTELGGLLRSVTGQLRRRSLLVIVSDLFTDLDAVYDGLNRLRFHGHEVLIMQVLDRDELELPFDGPTIFRDIEGDEELFAEPWAFRRSYQQGDGRVPRGRAQGMRQPRLRPRAIPHRRAARRLAEPVPPHARGGRPRRERPRRPRDGENESSRCRTTDSYKGWIPSVFL